MAEMTARLDHFAEAPAPVGVQQALNAAVQRSGLERSLLHLVKLRASQINGCAYCVDMHAHEARASGPPSPDGGGAPDHGHGRGRGRHQHLEAAGRRLPHAAQDTSRRGRLSPGAPPYQEARRPARP